MKWYKRFPGDFKADTSHLSLAEKGAYDALLDHYYATEEPLPPEVDRLCRIAGAVTEDEKTAVKRVAAQFFPMNGDGGRHNKRADEEIAKAQAKAEAKSKGGSARAKAMDQSERSEAARRAANARWSKEE